ncbi:MAG: class I SAM-dependent methyltransferase [Reyranella sp.]|uniref:class I SAM-dependent methyltransferase n=1 Tax=Reyranella sp. TaxID=1929291 RepID=UPI0011F8EDBE|nr:class I SAM-dependent methyltransferase [Reyranella sp.]TAJ39018.1 MAG: class I SAM-dependent methyltransferase [Reyranella sp.]
MKTPAELATEQAAYWNGPGGKGWLASIERIEQGIGDFGKAALVAANAQPGEKVIDVGCGLGGTTRALAEAVGPQGRVLGVDISEELVASARSHRVPNATFVLGNAATHPFEAAGYDLVFSRFGVMFFGDPVAAFRNFQQALKPSGRLVFICWRTPNENPWGLVPVRAAAPFLPPLPRPGPEDPGQFAFGDRVRVERILKEAGFGALSFKPLDQLVFMGKSVADILASAGRFGPLARAFADATPEQIEKAKAAIAEALTPHETAEGVRLPGACWLVTARASAG